jgi:hypothetical protein
LFHSELWFKGVCQFITKLNRHIVISIHITDIYCKDWCLTLNINKTKIIIFNKTGRLIKDNFILDGQEIDCITRYIIRFCFCFVSYSRWSFSVSFTHYSLCFFALNGGIKTREVFHDFGTLIDKSEIGAKLSNKTIGCLLYGDDLVLISDSKQRLQKQLDILDIYCKDWCLTLNINKTKIIICLSLIPGWITVSNALRKYTKHTHCFTSTIYLSTRHFSTNRWSDVRDFSEKPIWLSWITLCFAKNFLNLIKTPM